MAIFQSFDPTSMGPEDLRAIFVAREKLLDYGLKRIKESGAGKSKKHLLLVGPRGSGKTHLQLMTYYAVKENFSNKWLALKFPEEEYSITSMADLLLQILHEMGQEEVEGARELYDQLLTSNEDDIKDKAIGFIKEYHRKTGKNLLLLLENFQDLADQMDTPGMQALRAFIQENDFLMLFPSALSVFRQVADYKEPFYGFFEVVPLKEITLKDTEELLLKLAEWEGRKELIEEIKAERERIKGLFNLTGGSVRLIVLLYHIISHQALSEVEEGLYNLLNELTPYYQYQMMVLSPQQRKIIDSMALFTEGRIQPKELNQRTRIDPRVISTQLKQLKDKGYVRSHPKGRIVKYEVTERLFRIWRETRLLKGKAARINFLTEFFKYYYKPVELWDMYKLWKTKYQSALDSGCVGTELKNAQIHCDYLSTIVNTTEFKDQFKKDHFDKAIKLIKQGKIKESILEVEKVIDFDPKNFNAWILKGGALIDLDRYEEALAACEQAIELNSKFGFAWTIKETALIGLGRLEEALSACEQAIELNPKDNIAWRNKRMALIELGHHEEALSACEQAIELNPKDEIIWRDKGISLGSLGRYEEALSACEQAIELNPKDDIAWRNKGIALGKLARYKEALSAFDQVIELNPKDNNAWANKGLNLIELDLYEEALTASDRAIELNPKDSLAWQNKIVALGNLGRIEEYFDAFNLALELNPKSAFLWMVKGISSENLNHHEETLSAYDKALKLAPAFSTVLVNLFLNLSARATKMENFGIADQAFIRAVECLLKQSVEKQKEPLVDYFKQLFQEPKPDFIERTLNRALSTFPEMETFLKPFSRALEYLKAPDEERLNDLHPEEQAVVKDILGLKNNE